MRTTDLIFSLEPEDERHAAFLLNGCADTTLKVAFGSCGPTQRPCNTGAGRVDLTETGLDTLKQALRDLLSRLDTL